LVLSFAGIEKTKNLKTHSQIKIKTYANAVGLGHCQASYGFALFFVCRNIEKRFFPLKKKRKEKGFF
jgi:hypothetical protein